MTVYIVGLVVFLAAAAIFLEFSFWLEREVRETNLWEPPSMEPRNAAQIQAEQDAFNDLYLARRPYDRTRDDSAA